MANEVKEEAVVESRIGTSQDGELSPEDEKALAGLETDSPSTAETEAEEEEVALLSEEYQYPQDVEDPEERDDSQSPVSRTVVVAVISGLIVGLGALIAIFVGGVGWGDKAAEPEPAEDTTVFEEEQRENEAARYQTELALSDQQAAQEGEEDNPETPEGEGGATTVVAAGDTQAEGEESTSDDSTSYSSPSRSSGGSSGSSSNTTSYTPPSRSSGGSSSSYTPPPASTPSSARTTPSFSSGNGGNDNDNGSFSPPPTPEPQDPLEQWQLLASLGEEGAILQEAEAVEEANESSRSRSESGNNGGNSAPAFTGKGGGNRGVSQVTIGNPQSPSRSNFRSRGARGIINRRKARDFSSNTGGNQSNNQPQRYQIPIGSVARGKVSVPIVWSSGESGSLTQGRFTITLAEPLRAANGDVALPRGTVIVTQAQSIASNGLVSQFPIAIAYRDRRGNLLQQEIPPDSFSIRGSNNAPLIARNLRDPGDAIAQQDLLVGILGAGARATELINEPDEEFVDQRDTRFSSTSRRSTTREDRDILAAAFEGFFGITRDRLVERSNQATQELLNRQPVFVVDQGTGVTVIVNSFLEVNR